MTQTYINIKGEVRETSSLQIPAGIRKFRDHWVLTGDVVSVDWDAALEDARNKATLSRAAFALTAAKNGWITEAEAIAWAGGNSIPTWVETIIDTQLPEDRRLEVKISLLTQAQFPRVGILMPLLKSVLQLTDEQVDEMYGIDVRPTT